MGGVVGDPLQVSNIKRMDGDGDRASQGLLGHSTQEHHTEEVK